MLYTFSDVIAITLIFLTACTMVLSFPAQAFYYRAKYEALLEDMKTLERSRN